MNRTKIEWVKNPDGTPGYTWNPITGCLNGCEYCYARKLANGRLRTRYLANDNYAVFPPPHPSFDITIPKQALTDPFYPRFWEDRLGQIPLFGKSLGIFVCDMSDLFGIGIPRQWTERVLNHIGECQRHRFYLLTKQPQNLIKFSPFPDNCWVGVTVTNELQYCGAIAGLKNVEAKVKYISFEPLLNRIRVGESLWSYTEQGIVTGEKYNRFDWVIIGAQTHPYKPPKLKWVEEITDACCKASIPYFLKDNLGFIIPGYSKGDKLKQEMPVCQKPQ